MALMFLLALAVSYPVFLIFAFGLSRLIFTHLEKAEELQYQERQTQRFKAKRVRRIERVARAKSNAAIPSSTGFQLSDDVMMLKQSAS